MRSVRTFLAIAMICVGAYIVWRMMHYPFSAAATGIVLGAAMMALGVVRLRLIYGSPRS